VTELIGWSATAVFTASYFFERPVLLRLFQMAGAALWLAYGVLLGASPVIVANLIVLLAVLLTTVRSQRRAQRARAAA
jgi:hypothetical protein